MANSNFPFVKNRVLRTNLDESFDHLVTLLPFTESTTYNEAAKSSFRKTIIIHTAAIVEALLFHVLDKEFTDRDVANYYAKWVLQNKVELYKVSSSHVIVSGDYKKIDGKSEKKKLNLGQVSAFLKDQKLLDSKLYKMVDSLRSLRNEQHIGAQTRVKKYSKNDMEKAFLVASAVKDFARKICS